MRTECWSSNLQSSHTPATLTHFITCSIYQLSISATHYKICFSHCRAFVIISQIKKHNVLHEVLGMMVFLFSRMPPLWLDNMFTLIEVLKSVFYCTYQHQSSIILFKKWVLHAYNMVLREGLIGIKLKANKLHNTLCSLFTLVYSTVYLLETATPNWKYNVDVCHATITSSKTTSFKWKMFPTWCNKDSDFSDILSFALNVKIKSNAVYGSFFWLFPPLSPQYTVYFNKW